MQDIFGISLGTLECRWKQVDKVDMVDKVDKVDMVGKDDKQGN